MAKNILTVYVDADACPVKEEIIQGISQTNDVTITFDASYAHMSESHNKSQWVYVDSVKEEADLYIMNHCPPKDIVITQDIGLASVLLKKDVIVHSPRGEIFSEKNMDHVLHTRYFLAKERRKGNYSKGGSEHLVKKIEKNSSER